jgi:hypothetical protein
MQPIRDSQLAGEALERIRQSPFKRITLKPQHAAAILGFMDELVERLGELKVRL